MRLGLANSKTAYFAYINKWLPKFTWPKKKKWNLHNTVCMGYGPLKNFECSLGVLRGSHPCRLRGSDWKRGKPTYSLPKICKSLYEIQNSVDLSEVEWSSTQWRRGNSSDFDIVCWTPLTFAPLKQMATLNLGVVLVNWWWAIVIFNISELLTVSVYFAEESVFVCLVL